MDYQQGQPRQQLTLYTTCLDDMVPQENTVRQIDTFVDLELNLEAMGFKALPSQGRPPYHPADLLKLLHLRVHEPDAFLQSAGKGMCA